MFLEVCCVSRGLVPLHNACSYGHFEVTELLLKVQPLCIGSYFCVSFLMFMRV